MSTLPPGFKTFTADNVSGAAVTPKTTCKRIILYENGGANTDDYTVSDGVGTITKPSSSQLVLVAPHGTIFVENIPTSFTVKKATAGTMTFAQEEHGE